MKDGYEDLYFITLVYLNEPCVVLNSKPYYCWMMRYEHSTSGKMNINNIESLGECLKLKVQLIEKLGINNRFPELWIRELSRRIFTVIRYVSPVKVKMKLKDRIAVIKHFGDNEVFSEKDDNEVLRRLYHVSKPDWLIYVLFKKRFYLLLYMLVTIKQRISE